MTPESAGIMRLDIHLTFHGNCEEALQFYSQCFNGTIARIRRSRKSLLTGNDGQAKVLYALFVAPSFSFIASDRTICDYAASTVNNTKLNLSFSDPVAFGQVLDQLSARGRIHLAVQHTPHASKVVVLTDRYAISWILSLRPDPDDHPRAAFPLA